MIICRVHVWNNNNNHHRHVNAWLPWPPHTPTPTPDEWGGTWWSGGSGHICISSPRYVCFFPFFSYSILMERPQWHSSSKSSPFSVSPFLPLSRPSPLPGSQQLLTWWVRLLLPVLDKFCSFFFNMLVKKIIGLKNK